MTTEHTTVEFQAKRVAAAFGVAEWDLELRLSLPREFWPPQ